MTVIELETKIQAVINLCFVIARDIDVHKLSMVKTKEVAIAGRTTGLCELGDKITWEATHFGIRQQQSVEITQFNQPFFFEDQMVSGAFKSMRHEHHFIELDGWTVMKDKFEYAVPYGWEGAVFNTLILKRYITRLLITRNSVIKNIAEKKNIVVTREH